jgi:hypothetical protein
MSLPPTFLREVLSKGRLLLREPPASEPLAVDLAAESAALLEKAYRQHALAVAGPAIPFDTPAAFAAGRVLYQAGWYLLNPNALVEAASLQMPADPRTPGEHLSAICCCVICQACSAVPARCAPPMR